MLKFHVENFLSETNVDILIHGHTHKPQIHNHKINNRHCERNAMQRSNLLIKIYNLIRLPRPSSSQ